MDEIQSNNTEKTTQEPQTAPSTLTNKATSFAIPIAILFGFGMIAAAILMDGDKAPVVAENTAPDSVEEQLELVPLINETDHVLGNPNAPIVIVEYSDYDCPFCKVFHDTMNGVMDTYGTDGKVAWVFRNFPIEKLHPSSPHIAAAAECAAKLGGNEAFWAFSDLIFGEREQNQLTDTSRLSEFAATVGVDETAFNSCLESEETISLVEEDLVGGVKAGVTGTPFSFIMIAGQQLPVNGAQPLEYMVGNIDNLLKQLEQTETQAE